MTPVRLLLVDDDPLVRAGLSFMLGGADDIEIVGEAADGAAAEDQVERVRPDVVLMDVRMPRCGRADGDAAAARRPEPPQIVVLTTFHADEQVLRALRAGASGFPLKDTPPAQIVEAVRRVAAGDPVLSPAVTRRLMRHAAGGAAGDRRTRARERVAALAEREREVALRMGRGLAHAQTAADLFMSVPTVKTHVSRILAKLSLGNRVQTALLVHDAGLLDEDAY
ncbi:MULTISPECIES: response regulator transcription factor [unclassified Streptomyces]|uniref:response regulator n=1 Tax=unclassified Streptomyces TaxID=2593676 RepID=UPI000370B400|nr:MULTISPECIES: response regulator transcription factor [unclassified Streptomyces]